MKQTVKKITSLVLVLALSLVFLPLRADASTVSQEKNTTASKTLFRAQGNQISSAVCAELEKRDIQVKEDTVVKIISLGSGKGTAIQAINRDGNTATVATLTAIDEEGQPKVFTAADMAQTRGAGGGNDTVNPFNNTFSITFLVSFNCYIYTPYTYFVYEMIQPQTAMFRYSDNNQLYTVKGITMEYICSGVIYNIDDNENITPLSNGNIQHVHTITVSKTNPARNTYYSNNNNPYDSNRVLYLGAEPGGHQWVDYALVVVRKSDNKQITIEDYTDLNFNFPS